MQIVQRQLSTKENVKTFETQTLGNQLIKADFFNKHFESIQKLRKVYTHKYIRYNIVKLLISLWLILLSTYQFRFCLSTLTLWCQILSNDFGCQPLLYICVLTKLFQDNFYHSQLPVDHHPSWLILLYKISCWTLHANVCVCLSQN